MMDGIARMLKGKVGFGRFAAPLWAVLVGGLAIVAAAGQAVGPVLSGSISGQAGVTVSQTLLLSPQLSPGHVVKVTNGIAGYPTPSWAQVAAATDSPDAYVITVNDEQTSFRAAIETKVGRALTLGLSIENESTASGTPAHAELRLDVPAGIRAEVVRVTDQGVEALAQLGRNTWLFTLSGDDGKFDDEKSDILVTFKTTDDAAPGFYTLRGSIRQVTH